MVFEIKKPPLLGAKLHNESVIIIQRLALEKLGKSLKQQFYLAWFYNAAFESLVERTGSQHPRLKL